MMKSRGEICQRAKPPPADAMPRWEKGSMEAAHLGRSTPSSTFGSAVTFQVLLRLLGRLGLNPPFRREISMQLPSPLALPPEIAREHVARDQKRAMVHDQGG